MSDINDYDERQFKLMKNVLIAFKDKLISLSSLVGSLEFLFRALRSVDKDWECKFMDEVATLETINAVEIIENSEESWILEDEPAIEESEKEKAISRAFFNLTGLVKFKLRQAASQRMKKLDEKRVNSLSFPGFKIEEMEFSPAEKTLEISMEGAWLEEEGGKVLGNGLLIFSNWESLTVSRLNATTETWSIVDDAHPESLKNIEEYTFSNAAMCLRGLGEKTGKLIEWKMVGAQIDAEFEPELKI